MDVLIDTNVALDYFLKREGYAENAKRVFYEVISGDINGCLSSSVVTDIYFSVNKQKGPHAARQVVEEVHRYLTILTVGEETIGEALALPITDFEDAVQIAAANTIGITVVVTRDRHFKQSKMTVFEPTQFLEYLEKMET